MNGIGITRGDWVQFFTRPFTLGTLILAVVLVVLPWSISKVAQRRKGTPAVSDDVHAPSMRD